MRVLGIDPGLTRCGVGVVEVSATRVARFVDVQVVRTPSAMELSQRLLNIGEGIERLIDQHKPDAIALERVFTQHNVSTVMGIAQISGVAFFLAAQRQIPVGLHTPTEVKASVTGYGSADKSQVGAMVAKILNLAAPPRPADAADALALAICHAWRGTGLDSVARPSLAAVNRATTKPSGPLTPAQRAWLAAE
ncbi:crossover junction endodeoxyribonuclease RuvC [Lysinibacter sp. HNR]|uniref:crossover junction endodeoxyribonuclease RuvC n=1 Tax=Lysinibacter sp. HNR TaxID=3031408 RepID=UPI002435F4AD|nr:crossover junction endodeoxyribonuclease RuvC [Lysinibacter sp. HNR]WGD36309.1 crossover junction endodeoxyribonuclease RuvC [Lysinibacter sp. HNR]